MKLSHKPKFLALFGLAAALAAPTRAAEVPDNAGDVNPIKIGTQLPPITLPERDGKAFDLNASLKTKPTVLIFYRGGWCPFCNAQLSQLAKIQPDLEKLGYQMVAITPDSPAELLKTSGKNKLTYTLLSDSKMEIAQKMGLAFRMDDETYKKYVGYGIDLEKSSGQSHHLLPVPAVFLVGKDGMINFSYVNPNYKIRLNGDVLLAAAKAYR